MRLLIGDKRYYKNTLKRDHRGWRKAELTGNQRRLTRRGYRLQKVEWEYELAFWKRRNWFDI